MKTTKLILAVLLTVIGTAASATEGEKSKTDAPTIEVTSANSNVYQLTYKGRSETKAIVNIRNANKELVFTEKIKNLGAFARPYNFSNLPDGMYTMEVVEGEVITKKVIYHGDFSPNIEIPTNLNVVSVKPFRDNNTFKLTIINGGKTRANISILDADGRIVYNGYEIFEKSFSRLYNLEDLKPGASMEVELNGELQKFSLNRN